MLVDESGKIKVRNAKEVYASLEEHQKKNLKRTAFESAFLLAVTLLGQALFAADDDDDDYITNLMQYVYLRTVNEYSSANLYGISNSVISTVKSPVTAIRTIESFEPVTLATNIGSLFTGDYKPLQKTIVGLTPLKRIKQLSDIQKQINSYFYFNRSTLPFQHPQAIERKERREEREEKKKELEEMRLLSTRK